MARNIANAGYTLVINDASDEAMKIAKKDFGAVLTNSPKEVAE